MATPLKPGMRATDFTLPDQNGHPVSLGDFRGKHLVLATYPADWTPVCTGELSIFQEVLPDLQAMGAEVVALSCDTVPCHRAWAESQHLTFPMLSDFWPHGAVARRYGVFREEEGLTDRTLFFIDPGGTVFDNWVAQNIDIAPGIDLVFRTLGRMRGAAEGELRG